MNDVTPIDEAERLRAAIGPVGAGTSTDPIRPGEPWQTCPRCLGSDPAADAIPDDDCPVCQGTGVLDVAGEPFRAPPPFDGWSPTKLVELAASSRARLHPRPAEPKPAPAKSPRLTQSQIIERLTEKAPGRPKIELDYKKAPGDPIVRTTWHIELTADFEDAQVEAAYAKAVDLHDRLIARYAIATDDQS